MKDVFLHSPTSCNIKLVDPTIPSHRKILALFLVDLFQGVTSTANVPPQQREWWAEAVDGLEGKLDELPP